MSARIKWKMGGWNKVVGDIIDTEGVRRMRRVADACNLADDTDGYLVSVEGTRPLQKRNWRATVITAGRVARQRNRERNTLLKYFTRAGGA